LAELCREFGPQLNDIGRIVYIVRFGVTPMQPQPLYDGRNLRPAYQLRYGWTGWPTGNTSLPTELSDVARQTAEL